MQLFIKIKNSEMRSVLLTFFFLFRKSLFRKSMCFWWFILCHFTALEKILNLICTFTIHPKGNTYVCNILLKLTTNTGDFKDMQNIWHNWIQLKFPLIIEDAREKVSDSFSQMLSSHRNNFCFLWTKRNKFSYRKHKTHNQSF
jgi:hypothetical protein